MNDRKEALIETLVGRGLTKDEAALVAEHRSGGLEAADADAHQAAGDGNARSRLYWMALGALFLGWVFAAPSDLFVFLPGLAQEGGPVRLAVGACVTVLLPLVLLHLGIRASRLQTAWWCVATIVMAALLARFYRLLPIAGWMGGGMDFTTHETYQHSLFRGAAADLTVRVATLLLVAALALAARRRAGTTA